MSEETSTNFVRVLFVCEDCSIHRLPPRQSSHQYNAEEFRGDATQKAKVQVKTWSFKKAAIEAYVDDALFAVCPLDGERFSSSVERAVGSSRYFALKIASDTGKRAYLGVSFKERTEAFDFLSALQEWDSKKDWEDNKSGSAASLEEVQVLTKDLALEPGKRIIVKLKGIESNDTSSRGHLPDRSAEQVNTAEGLSLPPSSSSRKSRGQRKPS